jgi:hypothetical protein
MKSVGCNESDDVQCVMVGIVCSEMKANIFFFVERRCKQDSTRALLALGSDKSCRNPCFSASNHNICMRTVYESIAGTSRIPGEESVADMDIDGWKFCNIDGYGVQSSINTQLPIQLWTVGRVHRLPVCDGWVHLHGTLITAMRYSLPVHAVYLKFIGYVPSPSDTQHVSAIC